MPEKTKLKLMSRSSYGIHYFGPAIAPKFIFDLRRNDKIDFFFLNKRDELFEFFDILSGEMIERKQNICIDEKCYHYRLSSMRLRLSPSLHPIRRSSPSSTR